MELQYLVREPYNLNSKTPILYLLHGYGSNEEDLFSFREDLPEDFLIVSFRAPMSTPMGGHAWYDIDFMDKEKFVDLPQAKAALNLLMNSLKEIPKRYNLEAARAHLCGFSQGGVLAYTLALTYPDLFSKVALLSSYPEEKLLLNTVKDKKKFEPIRFFVSHGSDDATIPLEWGAKAADLLYDLGCYFTFREYMAGHGVNLKNYMDLMKFFKS